MNPCATCGACCRSYVVPVCGHDVWLLSTSQRLAPEQFLVTYRQKEATAREGFRLTVDGPLLGLALDKRGRFAPNADCVFLVLLAGENARCGVYADRPLVCQSYPMSLWMGVVSQREDSLCPPNSWPPSEIQHPAWRAGLQRLRMHFDIYHEVVARWNARVARAGPNAAFVLAEYYSYILNVYDVLARLNTELDHDVQSEIEATWPGRPHPANLGVADGEEPSWLRYFLRARDVIDGYYPDLPSQPPLLLTFGPRAADFGTHN